MPNMVDPGMTGDEEEVRKPQGKPLSVHSGRSFDSEAKMYFIAYRHRSWKGASRLSSSQYIWEFYTRRNQWERAIERTKGAGNPEVNIGVFLIEGLLHPKIAQRHLLQVDGSWEISKATFRKEG